MYVGCLDVAAPMAGGVMPYVYFRRPQRWPDGSWLVVFDAVRQHICESIDRSV